mgnify:CR=1 FL=1
MKKRLVAIGLAIMTAITLPIAGCGEGKDYIKMSYYDETSYEEGADYSTINENLFYRNERKVDVADPCVVYVDDENDTDYGSDVYVRHLHGRQRKFYKQRQSDV